MIVDLDHAAPDVALRESRGSGSTPTRTWKRAAVRRRRDFT
jgi:hypothetical protein